MNYVDIGKGVKIIKEFAFRCCRELETLSLPHNIETIESMAFSYTGLKELIIPPFCSKITGNPIAYNNVRIQSNSPHFIVEDDILFTSNKNEVISFQSSISTFKIPNSVTRIGSYAFWYSTNLKNIVIPPSVKDIGINPFAYCSLVIDNQSKDFSLKWRLLIDNRRNSIVACYSNHDTIYIPDGVKSIESSAFCNSKIKEVKMPYSLRNIKDNAFESSTIEKVELPNSITKICKFAFYGCLGIKEFIVPRNVEYIGKSTFQFCRNLKAVYIPASVRYIGFKAFNDCQRVTVHSTGRRKWRVYDSINLIATTPGNKDRLSKILPKFLHGIIKGKHPIKYTL